MPLHQFKLGPAILGEATGSSRGRNFARAISDFSRGIGLSLAAKCVESREQMDLADELSCDEIQGEFLSPPGEYGTFTPAHFWLREVAGSPASRREAG